RRHAKGSAHVHRRDTEARSGEEPVAEDHDREPGGRGEHQEREQAPEARAPARAPAVLAHPLARDERRALAQVRDTGGPTPRRPEADRHYSPWIMISCESELTDWCCMT